MEHCSIGIALHKKLITDGFCAVNYQDRIYLLLGVNGYLNLPNLALSHSSHEAPLNDEQAIKKNDWVCRNR